MKYGIIDELNPSVFPDNSHLAFTFFTDIVIWLGAKRREKRIRGMDLIIIPLKRKTIDGMMERERDLKRLSLLKHRAQSRQ